MTCTKQSTAAPAVRVPSDPDAIVYRRDLAAMFGITLCRKRILELEKAGKFPSNTTFEGQATYRVTDIRAWIAAKFAQPQPHRQVPPPESRHKPRIVRGKAGRVANREAA
jgi:hypothetical protein